MLEVVDFFSSQPALNSLLSDMNSYPLSEFDHRSLQYYFFFKRSTQCFVNVVSSKTLMT